MPDWLGMFLTGVFAMVVPGLVTGYVLAGLMGWAIRRDEDRCLRRGVRPPLVADPGVHRVSERIPPPVTAPTVHVHLHQGAALPPGGVAPGVRGGDPRALGWPAVVDGLGIRDDDRGL